MPRMRYLIAALLITVVFFACKQTPPTHAVGREDMLRKGKWRISKGTLTAKVLGGRDTTFDLVGFIIPSCHQADYIVFDSQYNGTIFYAGNCDSVGGGRQFPFQWRLTNNGSNLDLYNVFDVFRFTEAIGPVYFDTISTSPLQLDTVYTHLDPVTNVYTQVVLDSMWRDTIVASNIVNGLYVQSAVNQDIYDAAITNFSQSSFTIQFTELYFYLDTSNNHANMPRQVQDTLRYNVTYTNF